jgi:hypothetical protein
MAESLLSYTMKDYSGESATVVINAPEYNAFTYSQYLTDIGTFRTALIGNGANGICWGGLQQEKQTLWVDNYSNVRPTDENMLRSRKWSITYQDNTTNKKYNVDIPCAKVTLTMLVGRSDLADLTHPDWASFKSAFEAAVRSLEGNTVTILYARLVGRKL